MDTFQGAEAETSKSTRGGEQCSICQKSSRGRESRRRGGEAGEGVSPSPPGEGPVEGAMPPPQKMFDFFHFKIVNSGAFGILILKFYLQSNAGKGCTY